MFHYLRLVAVLVMCFLLVTATAALADKGGNGRHDESTECRDEHPSGKDKDHPHSCDEGETQEGEAQNESSGSSSGSEPADDEKEHPHGGPPGQNENSEAGSSEGSSTKPGRSQADPPAAAQDQPGTGTLDVQVASVAQLGSTLTYRITVVNEGTAAVSPIVQNTAPEEVDFVSSNIAPSATGAGSLTWSLTDMQPDATETIEWTGRVARLGDFDAANVTTLAIGGATVATEETHTYLATVRGIQLQRSATEPDWGTHKERRVIERPVTGASTDPSTTVGGATLPQTGMPVRELSVAAALLILGGLVLIARNKRLAATSLMIVLIAAACTSDPAVREAAPEPTATEDDNVLGTRVERDGQDDEAEDQGAGEDGSGTEDDGKDKGKDEEEADDAETDPSDTEDEGDTEGGVVTDVVFVEVPNEAPAPEAVGSESGANSILLVWDEPTRTTVVATSSRMFDANAVIDVEASLNDTGEALASRVRLANITEDRRFHVQGHLVLTVDGLTGPGIELTSSPIDVVLDPGDEVAADFTFVVPSGEFIISSAFVAS